MNQKYQVSYGYVYDGLETLSLVVFQYSFSLRIYRTLMHTRVQLSLSPDHSLLPR